MLHEERRSRFLSNGRRHGSTSYRVLWKEGECGALSVLNAFLGATCERPHEMHKGKERKQRQKYKRKKTRYVNISLNLFSSFDISSHRLQFTQSAFPVTGVTRASLLNF